MKRYRTLFYHAKWGDGKWIDNAIAISTQLGRCWDLKHWDITRQGISHEEIWLPDEDGRWHEKPQYKNWAEYTYGETIAVDYIGDLPMYCRASGTCYTSTMGQVRGGNNVGSGTCKRDASLVLKHPERWSYTEHEVSDGRFECMMNWMNGQVVGNIGYGFRGDKNICSEFSHNANVIAGELAGPHRLIDPLGDAILMAKSGKKLIKLKG
jgi:hypothetical protein